MASCQTARWVSTAPYVKLTVTQSASDDTSVTLALTLQYISDSAASTNGVARPFTVKVAGTTVKEGSYNINGVTGTKTIWTGTKKISKTTAAQTITFSVSFQFNLTWSGTYGGTKSASGSISVPAKTSYKVTYNANGGSGAPAAQTKWHGTNLVLSSTKPTRTGYSFKGWALTKANADAGTWYYQAGSTCGRNENLTLYAVWEANTYAVTYNANGGSGAPAAQTKTYGVNLTLSTTKPTRTNYTFKGWGTAASATTVAYAAGASYTANAAVTLYAIWELNYVKPRITNFTVTRCDSAGTASDSGSYCLVKFNWACDRAVSAITIECIDSAGQSTPTSVSASGTSGSVSEVIGNGALSNESTYTIRITVTDSVDYNSSVKTLNGIRLGIDFLNGGNGVSFGKPAELSGVADFAFEALFRNGIRYVILETDTNFDDIKAPGFYTGFDIASNNYGNCPLSDGSFTLEVAAAGGNGQLRQCIYECDKQIPEKYERYSYASSGWGAWIKLSPTDLAQTIYYTPTAANAYELVGSITIPAYKFFTVTVRGIFNNASCKGIVLGENNTNYKHTLAAGLNEDMAVHFPSCTYSGYTGNAAKTFYIWGKWAGTNQNTVKISGFYLPY